MPYTAKIKPALARRGVPYGGTLSGFVAADLGYITGTTYEQVHEQECATGELMHFPGNLYPDVAADGTPLVQSPTNIQFDWLPFDNALAWCRARGITPHGGTPLYYMWMPAWLHWSDPEYGSGDVYDAATNYEVARKVLVEFVRHYADKPDVFAFAPVNEPITDTGACIGNTFFGQLLGNVPGTVEWLYRQAAAERASAGSSIKLYINENSCEFPGAKADALLSLCGSLKAAGVLDAVGFQFHLSDGQFGADIAASAAPITANLQRFAALGLDVYVTEFAFTMGAPPVDQTRLSDLYYHVTKALLAVGPSLKFIQSWGFADDPEDGPTGLDRQGKLFWGGPDTVPGVQAAWTPKIAIDGMVAAANELPAVLTIRADVVSSGSCTVSGYRPSGHTAITVTGADHGPIYLDTAETWHTVLTGITAATTVTVSDGTSTATTVVAPPAPAGVNAPAAVLGLALTAPAILALSAAVAAQVQSVPATVVYTLPAPQVQALAAQPGAGVIRLPDGTPLSVRYWDGSQWAVAQTKLYPFT